MEEYYYNTKIPLRKAGKIINTKIIVSLLFIWVALIASSFFLLTKKEGGFLINANMLRINNLQDKQSADGAFVLVVRNKKMTLTRYTAYVDSAETAVSGTVVAAASDKRNGIPVVVRQVKNNTPKKSEDFSIKNVPQ